MSLRFFVLGCKVSPLDKWESHYPDTPLPEINDQGEEMIQGVLTKCAYIVKPVCKADHCSVMQRISTRIKHKTRIAAVQEGDNGRLSEVLQSTRAKLAFICIICFHLFCK